MMRMLINNPRVNVSLTASRHRVAAKIAVNTEIMAGPRFVHGDERLLDFHYAVQISLCLLKPIGAWPLERKATTLATIVYGSSIVIATSLQLFIIVPWLIHIVVAKWSFYDILRTACPLIFAVTVFLRYLLLLLHRNEIRSCIDRIAEDWRNALVAEDREIMLANARSGRLFGIISVAFMFGSGVLYCAMPIAMSLVITEDNVTIKLLPDPCELFLLDVQVNSMYDIDLAVSFQGSMS